MNNVSSRQLSVWNFRLVSEYTTPDILSARWMLGKLAIVYSGDGISVFISSCDLAKME
ncbi:hypothetical protein DPMN_022544 [Dreissena polymorpha]|uniref:Uncharacterized protein n=1 Tax=Dreissena polymorpha TaxID=45954 RepID=A0A9D4NPJ6_DREPO|nr:hypothetical protein DPMN_022544 [Dreissena polymorpha]